MKTKTKRYIGILFGLALAMGLMLGMSATACAGTSFGSYLVTNTDTAETLSNKVVQFNNTEWYIIADDSTAVDAGTVTMIAKNPIGASRFHDSSNAYSSSAVKKYLDGLTVGTGSFAGAAGAIVGVDLGDAGVKGAKLWLLSLDDVRNNYDLSKDVRQCDKADEASQNIWWLRSPGSSAEGTVRAACVDGDNNGFVRIGGFDVNTMLGVRPALKLNLSKVVFDSTAKSFDLVESYPLVVGTQQVDDKHLSGQGWSYDKDGNTLTLKGANITGNMYGIYYYGTTPFHIVLQSGSESTITGKNFGIYCTKDGYLTVSGGGSLNVSAYGEPGYGIYAYSGVTISGGMVTANGTKEGIGPGTITVGNDMAVTAGENETAAKPITDTDTWEHKEKWVRVAEAYPLWVGGTQVTSANASDVFGDKKVSYDDAAQTLTLNGYTYSGEGYNPPGNGCFAIYSTEDLTIELKGNGNRIVCNPSVEKAYGCAICVTGDLTFTGNGLLEANGSISNGAGIHCDNMVIGSGSVIATGWNGIHGKNVKITGGTVTAAGDMDGIFSKSVEITGGTVTATSNSFGIQAQSGMTITGGTVTCEGAKYGIKAYDGKDHKEITIQKGINSVTVTGGEEAMFGTVRNAAAGTGWTDKEGTQGKAYIAASDGQKLDKYKKVRFPAQPYIVTFTDGLGNTLDTQHVDEGKAATAPADPTRDGYIFNGWDTDFSKVTADLTVMARWKQNIVTHKVTFEDGLGKVLDTQTVVDGRPATAPAAPTRGGFVFSGWDTDFSSVTTDLTVRARWTPESSKADTYTVVFVFGFGHAPVSKEVSKGGSAAAPAVPEVDGFTFTGWDKEFTNITGNLTVTAQWKKNTAGKEHTVVFVDGYHNVPLLIQRVKDGNSAKPPENPEREGYTFDGWDTDFSYVTSNLTVIAQWKQGAVKTVTVNSATVSARTLDAAVKKAGGSRTAVTTIILGKKVKKISKGAFRNYRNAGTLAVKTKKLTKKSVRGSLKGSKVKTVKVKVGKKKVNKKYIKKYKKIFTKKNAGRKAKVSL